MGVSASGLRVDRHQHDDARSGAPVFHASLEFNGRTGRSVFLDSVFWELSGHGGDELAPAAIGIFENDQRGVFLLCAGTGVPGAGPMVSVHLVRGDWWDWLLFDQSVDQPARDTFAVFKRGGGGELAEFFVGDRRRFQSVPGGFFPGASELAGAGRFARRVFPCPRPGAFRAESGSDRFLGDKAEAIVRSVARDIAAGAVDFAGAPLFPLRWG